MFCFSGYGQTTTTEDDDDHNSWMHPGYRRRPGVLPRGWPRPSKNKLTTHIPPPPASSSMTNDLIMVTVPKGVLPGQTIHVATPDKSGRLIKAVVPPGMTTGSTFLVQVVPLPVATLVQEENKGLPSEESIFLSPVSHYGEDETLSVAPPPAIPPTHTPRQMEDSRNPPRSSLEVEDSSHFLPTRQPDNELETCKSFLPPQQKQKLSIISPSNKQKMMVVVPPGTPPGTPIRAKIPNTNQYIMAHVPANGATKFYVEYSLPTEKQQQQQHQQSNDVVAPLIATGVGLAAVGAAGAMVAQHFR